MNKKLLIYAMFSLVVLSIFACNLNVQKTGRAGDDEPGPSPSKCKGAGPWTDTVQRCEKDCVDLGNPGDSLCSNALDDIESSIDHECPEGCNLKVEMNPEDISIEYFTNPSDGSCMGLTAVYCQAKAIVKSYCVSG